MVLNILNNKSKDFAYEVSIAANDFEFYDFADSSETDDYAPFKNIQILNTGTENLKVYFNNQNGYKLVPAGTILDRTDLNISFLKIVNTSATAVANFTMTLDNDVSEKQLLKELVLNSRGN